MVQMYPIYYSNAKIWLSSYSYCKRRHYSASMSPIIILYKTHILMYVSWSWLCYYCREISELYNYEVVVYRDMLVHGASYWRRLLASRVALLTPLLLQYPVATVDRLIVGRRWRICGYFIFQNCLISVRQCHQN